MSTLNRLYDEVIRRHNRQPYHFEKKTGTKFTVQAYNPICGDRFEIFMDIEGKIISGLYFYGYGCAVSKASASVLVRILEGKTLVEAKQISEQFLRLLKGELNIGEILSSDEFKSFAVVQEIPARYECAALAWAEMDKILIGHL